MNLNSKSSFSSSLGDDFDVEEWKEVCFYFHEFPLRCLIRNEDFQTPELDVEWVVSDIAKAINVADFQSIRFPSKSTFKRRVMMELQKAKTVTTQGLLHFLSHSAQKDFAQLRSFVEEKADSFDNQEMDSHGLIAITLDFVSSIHE